MPRPISDKTKQALALIGQPDKNGKPHTAYSAAKLTGGNLGTIYKMLKAKK